MDKSRKSSERFGRTANEEAAGTVFDLPILGDRTGPTPWELWERGTAQADWRDFVESSCEAERDAVPQLEDDRMARVRAAAMAEGWRTVEG